jgi:hypothetical protein
MSHKLYKKILQNCKKLEFKKNVFYVIAFDLIKISWASQNGHQILYFVKATDVFGKKMTRDSSKMLTS